MANESVLASGASNRDVGPCAPGPFQDCSDVVHLSVFFDGTGNNKDADEADKKWSNVARMWRAALMRVNQESDGIYPIYVAGVGTRFNGQAASWRDRAGIWLEDNTTGGLAGGGGDRRMDFAADNVNARLRDRLLANAARFGGELAAYSEKGKAESFGEVNRKLAQHRLIKVINLSVFGFSRGAALARAFANRVVELCERRGNDLYYEGYPLRLSFAGLFDTVASFGVPAQNARLPWDERELLIPREMERCVHFVAAHELRFAFPVDLIRVNGQLDGRWVEKCYPGVHSDVGGGYQPINQGISNNYARIPMRDMMVEAVMNGVRMLSYGQVAQRASTIFAERFEIQAHTLSAYRGYMRHATATEGRLEDVRRQHMRLLYSAYGTLHRRGEKAAGDNARDASLLKFKRFFGPGGMGWEVQKYRAALHQSRQARQAGRVRFGDALGSYAQYVKPEDWQLAAWDATAPEEVASFVRDYVHDSKVDFVGNIEPFSYFRLRTMQESTRSVWNETGDWISAQADAAKRKTTDVAVAAKNQAEAAADAARRKADEAKQAAQAAYERARSRAVETYDAAKHKSIEAYEAGKHQAQAAYEAAQRQAQAAEREARRLAAEGRRIVEEGVTWVERQYDEAANAAERQYRKLMEKAGY